MFNVKYIVLFHKLQHPVLPHWQTMFLWTEVLIPTVENVFISCYILIHSYFKVYYILLISKLQK